MTERQRQQMIAHHRELVLMKQDWLRASKERIHQDQIYAVTLTSSITNHEKTIARLEAGEDL